MQTQCEQAILEYAPVIRQLNAALMGEHSEYVQVVLQLFRDHYRELLAAGETEWSNPDTTWLDANKPY